MSPVAATQPAEIVADLSAKEISILAGVSGNEEISAKVAVALAVPVPATRTDAEAAVSVVLVRLASSKPSGFATVCAGINPQPAKSVLAPNANRDPKTIFFIFLLLSPSKTPSSRTSSDVHVLLEFEI